MLSSKLSKTKQQSPSPEIAHASTSSSIVESIASSSSKELDVGAVKPVDIPERMRSFSVDQLSALTTNTELALKKPNSGLFSNLTSNKIMSVFTKYLHKDLDQNCFNDQPQLQCLQLENVAIKNRLNATLAELHSVKKTNEELDVRFTTERAFNEDKIKEYDDRISLLSNRMDDLLKNYQEYRRSTNAEFLQLAQERESAQRQLTEIERHYSTLLGNRRCAAREMNDPINLPTDRSDLELYALQMRENLLASNVSREHVLKRLDQQTLTNNEALKEEALRHARIEETLKQKLVEAHNKIDHLTKANDASSQSAELKQAKLKNQELYEAWKLASDEVALLKNKVSILQVDLQNSEVVQKDFVILSQHLQVQLEKQRTLHEEVRWQDAEDVTNCSSCEYLFPTGSAGAKRKLNCRHCGQIFCPDCLTQEVPPTGNRKRSAIVCDMCHTLLVKHVAPYFSRHAFTASKTKLPSPKNSEKTLSLLDRIQQPWAVEASPSHSPKTT